MFSKKTLSVCVFSAVLSLPAWGWNPADLLPFVTDQSGNKTLSSKGMKSAQCPEKELDGWKSAFNTGSLVHGWADLWNYTYKTSANNQPGAAGLADDYAYYLQKEAQYKGLPASEWAYMPDENADPNDSASYQTNKTIVGTDITTASKNLQYAITREYEPKCGANTALCLMVNNLSQCGTVVTFVSNGQSSLKNAANKMQTVNGVQQCTTNETPCAIKKNMPAWVANNGKGESYKKLAAACTHFWNTLVNDTLNAENGINRLGADGKLNSDYQQYCDPRKGGELACTICTVADESVQNKLNVPKTIACSDAAFVGPGLVSYSGKGKDGKALANSVLLQYDGKTCTDGSGKIDIVAQ